MRTNRLSRWSAVVVLAWLVSGCIGAGGEGGATGPDPGVVDFPIAYVKRPYPVNNQGDLVQPDLSDPQQTSVGGDLYLRDYSSLSADEVNITGSITQRQGDVRDVDVSYDGSKIIFSLRLFDADPNNPPTPKWNIYEYDVETGTTSLVMTPSVSEFGNDVDPHYLPDGRIVFSSDRQKTSRDVLLSEGKEGFSALDESNSSKAFVLHTMDEDGANIQQISFNQSHDFDPVVLSTGEIVFTRWDNMGPGNGAAHLYKILPDGSQLQLLYGAHSHDTGTAGSTIQFMQPRPKLNGRMMAIIQPFSGTYGGGDIVEIDTRSYIDNDQPLAIYQGTLSGPAQVSATLNDVFTDLSPSPSGRYSAFFPLMDGSNRMLVSKSFCSIDVDGVTRACIEPWISDPSAQELPPEYSIWMYDLQKDTEKPVVPVETGMVITDVVAVQSRRLATIAADTTVNPLWETEGVGALHIRSVYDFGGNFNSLGAAATDVTSMAISDTPADQRPARFLRLVKAVGIPDPDDEDFIDPPDLANQAFGPNRSMGMREILGYTPVEPDGSVMVKVPANVAFTIEVLDQGGRRIGARHDNWMQLRAGETMQCIGCHTHQTQNGATPLPHGRLDAQATSVNQGAGISLPLPMPAGLKTVPLLYALSNETMSEVRHNRCNLDLVGCTASEASIEPSVDVLYDDIWTDTNGTGLTANPSLSYRYDDLVGVGEIYATADDAPVSSACQADWQKGCRIIINYEQHIQPMWEKDRGANTCTACHTTNGNNDVPDGQLDLTGGVSDENANHIESYRDLLFVDNRLILNPDLQDELVQVGEDTSTDPPTPIFDFVRVAPSMSQNGARVSYFMEKLTETELDAGRTLSTPATATDYVDHSTFMSASELRLIAEWLDIGAQYFNDPFDANAPQN